MQSGFRVVKKSKTRKIFYAGVMLLFALIFARNVLQIGLPALGFLALFLFLAFICDKNEMMALAVLCIPLNSSLQYKYALLGWMFIYFLRFEKDIRFTTAILPLLAMLIWEGLHVFLDFDFSILEYVRGFAELIFCTFLMLNKFRDYDKGFILRTLAVGTVFVCCSVFLILVREVGFDISKIFFGSYRFGQIENNYNFNMNFNPNGLGFICNLSIAGIFHVVSTEKRKWFDWPLLLALAVFGVMTMSRTFLICFVLIVSAYFLSGQGLGIKKRGKRLLLLLVLFGIMVYVLLRFMPTVVEKFIGRFLEDDVSNGRNDLLSFYNWVIFEHPRNTFFGLGMQNVSDKVFEWYDYMINVPHNGPQQLVVVWGVMGLILFAWFIIALIKSARQRNKFDFISFIPLFFVLINVMSGQLITAGHVLLSFSVVFIIMSKKKERKNG